MIPFPSSSSKNKVKIELIVQSYVDPCSFECIPSVLLHYPAEHDMSCVTDVRPAVTPPPPRHTLNRTFGAIKMCIKKKLVTGDLYVHNISLSIKGRFLQSVAKIGRRRRRRRPRTSTAVEPAERYHGYDECAGFSQQVREEPALAVVLLDALL